MSEEDADQVRHEIRIHRQCCDCSNPARFCLELYRLMERLQKAGPSTRWAELMEGV